MLKVPRPRIETILFYNSCMLSQIDYWCVVRAKGSSSSLNKVVKIQKKNQLELYFRNRMILRLRNLLLNWNGCHSKTAVSYTLVVWFTKPWLLRSSIRLRSWYQTDERESQYKLSNDSLKTPKANYMYMLSTFSKRGRDILQHYSYIETKDAMSVSFRSELFTSYILTIVKQWNLFP